MTPVQRLYRLARRNERDPVYQAGLGWYDDARALVRQWGSAASLGPDRVAAIVAALSPQVAWAWQVDNTMRFIRAELDKPGSGRYAGFNSNVRKARKLVRGADPRAVLGGDKVLSFYAALCGDERAVVVDRHMAALMGLGRLDRHGVYSAAVEAVWRVSARLGVAPARLQAAVWCVWKRQSESVPF